MPQWTLSPAEMTCGRCGGAIPAEQPIARLTAAALVRCLDCATALGYVVDERQVDAARCERERERRLERDRAASAPPPSAAPARFTLSRRLTRFSEMADALPFDAKRAAAGE